MCKGLYEKTPKQTLQCPLDLIFTVNYRLCFKKY